MPCRYGPLVFWRCHPTPAGRPIASTERVTAIGLIFINWTAGSLDHWISGCCLISGLRPLWSIGDIVHRLSGGSLRARPQVDASYLRSVWPRGAVTIVLHDALGLADCAAAVRRLLFSPFGAATLASQQFHEPISCPERPTPIRPFPRRAFRNRPPIRTFRWPRLVLVRVVVRVEEATPVDWRLNGTRLHGTGEKRNSISGVSGSPLCDPLGCCRSRRSAIQ